MATNIEKSVGRSKRYKLDAGGVPTETGPFIGIVKNNTDTTRTGKLMVYNEFLSGPDENDPKGWTPVSYVSPFYGTTQPSAPEDTEGTFAQNRHSYGMWFTPPDVGTRILFVFANGDPNIGYYLGSVVNEDAHHMMPAIGASNQIISQEKNSSPYFANSSRLPVIEFNDNNTSLSQTPRFFESAKPVHQVQAYVLLQQGLLNDPIRGTIGSNSYRESPSTVFGLSTPGRPVYQGGFNKNNLQSKLNQDANNPGSIAPESMNVVGREGGHSIVFDDGDIDGNDQLVRLRTAKGHQILLSDSGDTLYISHANGQSWIELGLEGTVDVYAANSVNIRSGDINLHADRNVNINGQAVNINSESMLSMQGKQVEISGIDSFLCYSETYVGLKSDTTLALQSKTGSWDGGSAMILKANVIDLNGGNAPSVPKTTLPIKQKLPDTVFTENVGWTVEEDAIESIVSRAPTHEPFPGHNTGVNKKTEYASPPYTPVEPSVQNKLSQIQEVEFEEISAEQYETAAKTDVKLGNLEGEQVTGMLAQASKNVLQTATEISDENGVGKYGFSAQQLEDAGYLKAGTVEFFIKAGTATLETILNSPSVWSGKNGITQLTGMLGNEKLQDLVKTDLYTSSFNELRSQGLITGNESPDVLASLVEPASQFGAVNVKQWLESKSPDETVTATMNKASRSAQFSVDLTDTKITEETKGFSTVTTSTSTNTVSRKQVDSSATTIIRETKVSPPSYTRTAEITQPSSQRLELEEKANEITTVEIPAAREKFFKDNPGTKFRDFVKSTEYKALVEKRRAINEQIINLQAQGK